jgi:hypothetical protein
LAPPAEAAGGAAGAGFCTELLQPARNASDNAAVTEKKIVRVGENIISFVRHPVVTNKFQNRQEFGIAE